MYPEGSRMESAEVDAEGNAVLSLERKSVQPFRTQDEYLYAMKEDLAEWFNTLYTTEVRTEDFFEHLETGVALCQHANNVNGHIVDQIQNGRDPINGTRDTLEMAKQVIQFKTGVTPGSFQCRDNISNYITWCRKTLGIPDTLLFESDDLVMRKNERNVVLCVLEVARRGARYGMLAPVLVQLENEIDAEIAGTEPPPRPQPPRPRRTNDMMSLDEMVREIAKLCTCPDAFPIIRVSEGKYKVGESLTLIFVRILRNHVMVRIGGGWDTLENYLNRHDPCRCEANKNQHKTRRYSQATVKRRASMTSPAPTSDVMRSPRQLPATPTTVPPANSADGSSPRSQVVRRNSGVTQRNVERVRLSDEGTPARQRPQSAQASTARPQSPNLSRRAQSPAVGGRPQSPFTQSSRRPQSPLPSRRAASPANTPARTSTTADSIKKPVPIRPQPQRPASAGPTAPQNTRPTAGNKPNIVKPQPCRPGSAGPSAHSRTLSKDDQSPRGRSPSRDSPAASHHTRSRSVGAEELRRNLIKSNTGSANDTDVIMITRNKSGQHIVNKDSESMNAMMMRTNGNGMMNGVGNSDRRLNSARMKISPDKLLPSKPKTIMRSNSAEVGNLSDLTNSVPGSSVSINSDTTADRPSLKRQASVGSLGAFGSNAELDKIPAPIADHRLNKEMEKVFEEYRRAEKGWFHYDDADEEVDMLSASASSVRSAPGGRSTRPQSAGVSRSSAPTTPRTSTTSALSSRTTPASSRKSSISESSSSSSLTAAGTARTRPMTPSSQRSTSQAAATQRRCITPTPGNSSKPLTLTSTTPRRSSLTTTATGATPRRGSTTTTATGTPQVTRTSSMRQNRHDGSMSRPAESPRARSQTPNPTPSTTQVRVQARCRTPVIQSRIDTGIRKRPTTPLSLPNPDASVPARTVQRSSSLSRVAINKSLASGASDTPALKQRSRSREDILDGDSSERKSRAEASRNRDIVQNGKRSASRDLDSRPVDNNPAREPPRSLPPTPGVAPVTGTSTPIPGTISTEPPPDPVTVEIPTDTFYLGPYKAEVDYQATPRKDDRSGVRTRIPRPSSARRFQSPTPEAGALKRFDSGVDINISPTETSSIQGDDDMCIPWRPQADQSAGYSEYY